MITTISVCSVVELLITSWLTTVAARIHVMSKNEVWLLEVKRSRECTLILEIEYTIVLPSFQQSGEHKLLLVNCRRIWLTDRDQRNLGIMRQRCREEDAWKKIMVFIHLFHIYISKYFAIKSLLHPFHIFTMSYYVTAVQIWDTGTVS